MIERAEIIRVIHSTPGCESIEAYAWKIVKVVMSGFYEETGNTYEL